MKHDTFSLRRTGLKYGFITAGICIGYFIIMSYSGFIHITALRFLNYAFLIAGIYMALNDIRHKNHKNNVNYLPGLGLGFIVVLSSSILFSVFIFIYARFIDSGFLLLIKPDLPSLNGTLNAYAIGIFVFCESLLFGVVLDFIVMQFFKRNQISGLPGME